MTRISLSVISILFIINAYCYSNHVEQISSIMYNRQISEHHQYTGSMFRHENRMFINSLYAINEYLILPDGSMERIFSKETGRNTSKSITYENRLYTLYNMNEKFYMYIFDISKAPMKLINTEPIEITGFLPSNNISPQVMGEYILLTQHILGSPFMNPIQKLNIHTMQIDGILTLPNRYFTFTTFGNFYITALLNITELSYTIRIYDSDKTSPLNTLGEIVNEFKFNLPSTIFNLYLKIDEGFLYAIGYDFIYLYDLNDIDNIKHVVSITGDTHYLDALLYENLLIVNRRSFNAGISIYDISNPESPTLEFIDNSNPFNPFVEYPMHIYNDKLYINKTFKIRIYDLKSNDFTTFSASGVGSDYSILRRADGLVLHNCIKTNKVNIASAFDEKFIYTINTGIEQKPKILDRYFIYDFYKDNDKLITISSLFLNNVFYFKVYCLNDGSLQYSIKLDKPLPNIYKIDDNIILLNRTDLINYIYKLHNDTLYFVGSFSGIIGEVRSGFNHPDYFLVFHEGRVEFRDRINPMHILYTHHNLPYKTANDFQHFMKNTIGIINGTRLSIFHFNDDFLNFRRTYSKNHINSNITLFDRFLSLNGGTQSSLTSFYKVENGVPQKIGEMNVHKVVRESFIYLDNEILLLKTGSGANIHVYDINYDEVSISDVQNVILKTQLMGNFPNPFNPYTSIKFQVSDIEPQHVRIDVFNIRGQIVKTLIDDYKDIGTHTVEWDGVDKHGNRVSSGVYLYRLETSTGSEVRRMLLMK